jgi:hypothetical protein
METHEVDDGAKGFVAAIGQDLDHLSVGCFVLVKTDEISSWVEIGRIDGDRFTGILHPELSAAPLCPIHHDYCEIARFRRDQIIALGCDRYCWC